MVETPKDKLDADEYDDLEAWIGDAMAEGYTIEAEDFEGRECQYCGETIPFVDWPEAVVFWDVQLIDSDEYYARYHFCSDDCKKSAMWDEDWSAEWEELHEDELEGNT